MKRSPKSKRSYPPARDQAAVKATGKGGLVERSLQDQSPSERLASDRVAGTLPSTDAQRGASDVALFPAPGLRSCLSLAIIAHLLAITVSFLAAVEPSATHLTLDGLLSPYLRMTHFGADRRAVYLAHGEPIEQPHRLQIRRRGHDEGGTDERGHDEGGTDEGWETIAPRGRAGLAAADRDGRWLATIASLGESNQAGIAASLLLPSLERMMAEDDSGRPPIAQVRIRRLPTELTTVVDDALPPPYVAAVVRHGERLDLVQVKEPRLNSLSSGRSRGRGVSDE